jgi:riboflavin synthase
MFTGMITAVGIVREVKPTTGGTRVVVDADKLDLGDVAVGDSIAVNGACLTVVALAPPLLSFDVSQETLNCTLGFAVGAQVNLEKSLRLADRLGGHLVSGHVDGVGVVTQVAAVGENRLFVVEALPELARYIARKGSIAVNGVSLTVNTVNGAVFEVNLIPHTLRETNLGLLQPGARVNLEADMLARYAERLTEN